MPEQVTVIITETAPGGGSRFYQEPGRPSSVDVDSLTPNTEYRADAEYESPDGTTIQASNSMTFRTLPVGMFSISNPNWQNDNDGQHSTFTFDYTSTYALSYAQVVDTATGVTYQGTVVGSSVTAQLPAGTAGTQHNFQITIADIYGYSYVQGYVVTLQASMTEIPFYIEAVDPSSNDNAIHIDAVGSPTSLTLEYSFDNSNWNTYTIGDIIQLTEQNPKVYFRNDSSSNFSTASNSYYCVIADDYIDVGGNIASLKSVDMRDTTSRSYDFHHFFYRNTHLRDASKLYLGNYTSLAYACYSYMFSGCTSLTKTPELPAITLANYCYSFMFNGCTSLVLPPELPTTEIEINCYYFMFRGCTSLISAPELPATTIAASCYFGMFYGCTSLEQAPNLPATTIAPSCYSSMFTNCTSLISAPVLLAKQFQSSCYRNMFDGCVLLDRITCLLESNDIGLVCENWLRNVSATGTFYKSPNMSSWPTGASGIPSGWTVVDYQN